MISRCFLLLALALFGASATPLGFGGLGSVVGPTVSESVVTPFHRTDAVSTPCGRSVVRTTAVPAVPYGLATGGNFLGTGAGVYPGVVAGGLTGGYAGTTGILTGGLGGAAGGVYPGFVGGLGGTGGIYSGLGSGIGGGLLGVGVGAYQGAGVGV